MLKAGSASEDAVQPVLTLARDSESVKAAFVPSASVQESSSSSDSDTSHAPSNASTPSFGTPALPLGTFYITIQTRSLFKRLQRMGECSLVPGVDSFDFEAFGAEMPESTSYSAICRNCFTGQFGDEARRSESSASSYEELSGV